ncbi:MATE family efflux transporter [Bacillus kexueae]|uniref:MATE family efflux transporter n=1 Tax=Aeribacillus kexueae TaxID=2078952 RepID=UPI001FAE9603|nr:MATE family efflux transporter [Bacillus kexueae]
MNQKDFTNGNIMKQLIVFSTPIIFTNLLQTSFQLIDSLWIGYLLGDVALGAVSVSATVIFTMLAFMIGLNQATMTILSQKKGMEDEEGIKRFINAFVVLFIILASVIGISGYVSSEWILTALTTPSSMIVGANSYLQIHFMGVIFLFGYNFIGTLFRSLGDSRTPVRFVAAAVICNTFLDPLFISYFQMGIDGAAYATIVSQGIAFLYGGFLAVRKKLIPFIKLSIPQKGEVVTILKLGIPASLQMTVVTGGVMAIMSVVTPFGEEVVAGYAAAQRLDSLIMLPAFALSTAVTSMAGQNIGARNWERVNKIAKYGTLYNFLVMTMIACVVVFVGQNGVEWFVRQESAISFGTSYLTTIAFFYPFLGINFMLNGILRAAGAMYPVLILNILSFWLLRYPITYWVSSLIGEDGIAIGIAISFVISSLLVLVYYQKGRWREKKIFEDKEKM